MSEYQQFLLKLNGDQSKHFSDTPPTFDDGTVTFHLKPGTPPSIAPHLAGRLAPKVTEAIKAAWGDAPGEVAYKVIRDIAPKKSGGEGRPQPATERIRVVDRRRPRYFTVDNELYDDGHAARMKPAGLSVYLCLCRHADYDTNDCYPSYATIAKKCGVSRPTVINHSKRLAQLGYIEIEHNFNSNGDNASNTFYLLDLPKVESS
jgi:hypothetical protein